MLARIFFYPTVAINTFMCINATRHWYDRIDETVILGSLPLKSVTRKLIAEENVRAMVTLNEDYELKHLTYSKEELNNLGIEQLQLSTTDLTGTPTQENITRGVKFLTEHREEGNTVYLHCKAGRTRSATLAVCYLMQIHQWDPEKAIDFVKSKRPLIWLRSKQMESIHRFHQSLKFS
ncbi:unnamed protein product [Lymnaea stagnalis]|uniref:Phosphatidylglycerophosphatase and protein-tyrosine phosphatase 1 n=1 Tax=Lymnaea stagnalis TaxID=6523 RepID=A0AAV2ICQ7_LYMST